MNRKALFAIIGGVAAGVIAVLLVQYHLQKQKETIFAGMELVDIIVAAKNLEAGTQVSKSVLSKRKMPKKYVHGSAITLKDVNLILGQELNYPLQKGDPVLWTDLGEESEKLRARGLADAITKGERALSIPVDKVSGVSGLLSPGDHVDILSTVKNPQTGETTTLTLMQNLTVLAIGGNISDTSGSSGSSRPTRKRGYSTITLQVTLEEAEILVFASEKGKLMCVLRNPDDIQAISNIPTVNYRNILKDEYRLNIQKKRNMIEVIKSGKVEK